MGDASHSKEFLVVEQHRLSTYNSHRFVESVDNAQLAKAGFYFTQNDDIKCFACGLEVKASDIKAKDLDIIAFHRGKKPECSFAQKLPLAKARRCKTFLSVADSLRFEKARLDTFVEWPVSYMSPNELARDGFYFLRTRDHCACVFCKGIIGAWEENDTPRGEHKTHFPHCPFVKGNPVGNIPMAQSEVLSKFCNSFASSKVYNPWVDFQHTGTEDVTGLGRQPHEINSHSRVAQKLNGISLRDIGLTEYRGPKYKEFLTYDNRLNSFKKWPERVKQQPSELAEAGFYYCGPSDHVRCFHCGNGICNWEEGDVPWDVHALWYPMCNFVLLTKGQDYVNKIRNGDLSETSGSSTSFVVTESDLESLMELDIMRAVLALEIREGPARGALRKKLEITGLPFFSVDQCMDAISLYMEEETKQFLEETYEDDESEDQAEPSPLQPPVNTNASDTSASSVVSSVPSSTPLSTASLPEVPPRTGPAPILPLPQLRTHMPVTSLLSPTMSQHEVPVRHTPGVPATSAESNRGESSQRHIVTSLPSLNDHSEGKSKQNLSQDPSLAGLKRMQSVPLAEKSSDELQEELDRARETMMCKVCLDAEMSILFLPCSHMATCASCAVNLSKCPVCRENIKYTIKPIFS